jgi:hypothetical protein
VQIIEAGQTTCRMKGCYAVCGLITNGENEMNKQDKQQPIVKETESLLDLLNSLNETELHHVQNSEEAQALLVKLNQINTTRPKELEKKRVVQAALDSFLDFDGNSEESFAHMYDLGFLKLP